MEPQKVEQTEAELVRKIESELHVDAKTATNLFYGLRDALGYHQSTGEIYCSEITVKDYRQQIESAHDALKKLNVALNQIPEKDREFLDSYYCEANALDMLMFKVADDHLVTTGQFKSGTQKVTERMEKALKLAESNVSSPGAGKGRREGKKYIAAIEMLARWFSDEFPTYELSPTPNTPFYKYVQIWFQCYVDPDDNDKDVRRHISNALNSAKRLHHVKG